MTILTVAQVQMPEKGVFLAKVPEELIEEAQANIRKDLAFVVTMDYGDDVCTILSVADYDPAIHGERIPGFSLLRKRMAADDATIAENARLAGAISQSFRTAAIGKVPDLRIVSERLSLGQKRIFIRYITSDDRPDFEEARETMLHRFGVTCNLRSLGMRDEVAHLGGLGPCGRVCCCCSWQTEYPTHLTPNRRPELPTLLNGTCNRYKCCLAFERNCS